jgi:heptosyltransferase-3
MGAEGFRRICLVHAGALGDFVLALRLVNLFKSAWPRTTLDVLGRPETAGLALGRAGVDGLASLEMPGLHSFFAESAPLEPRCVAYFQRFDLIVDMLGGPGSLFAQRLGQACSARVVSIEVKPRPGCSQHITDQWIGDLLAAGLGLHDPHQPLPRLPFEAAQRFEARARLQKLMRTAAQPIVLIHPGAGSPKKCWPSASFQALAAALRQSGVQPIFVVGPVELDLHGPPFVQALEESGPVLQRLNIMEAAALIAAADAYVGNDCGMTHLAAAVETPTVALFGPTDPAVWRPLGSGVRVLRGRAGHAERFAGLDVATVHRAVLACLESPPRPA